MGTKERAAILCSSKQRKLKCRGCFGWVWQGKLEKTVSAVRPAGKADNYDGAMEQLVNGYD